MTEPESTSTDAALTTSQSGGMNLSSLERASDVAQVAVVVLGVLAALAGAAVWYFSARVNAAKDAALDKFKAESAATIAEANTKSAEAQQGTAKALVEAAATNERAGKLEVQAAEQQERAAKAERELLQLQQLVAPRRLSPTVRAQLVAALKASPDKGEIDIEYVGGDAEGGAFAVQLFDTLRAGGWSTTPVNTGVYGGPAPIGMGIMVHSVDTAPRHARSLHAAFHAIGFNIGAIIESSGLVPEGVVKLMVGHKRQ